ncbi:MAG: hypothetical protein EOM90_12130 [Alphaproteobacteria bacterium]|nr:hypothetical protein [Alphaproteobacteria bacterium]
MSITKSNVITKNYKGKFGNQVVFRNRYGKSIMAVPPKKTNNEPTDNQVNARKKFALATRYAKNILQDPDMLTAYTARSRDGLTPYILAVTDYLKPPFVDSIDTSGYHGAPGDKIRVSAGDDFAVVEVLVQVVGVTGVVIEQGTCTLNQITGSYDFTATATVTDLSGITIIATARDIPGHTDNLSVTL